MWCGETLSFSSCLQNYTTVAAIGAFRLYDKRNLLAATSIVVTTLPVLLPVASRPYGVDNRRWLWLSSACHYLNRSSLKGIKSSVFHQFNIHSISEGQADSAALPRQTYGIRLKGSSFLRRPSSLNFLRSRYERALFKKVLPLSKSLDSVETLLPFTLRVV